MKFKNEMSPGFLNSLIAAFFIKNGSRRFYTYLVIGHLRNYFVEYNSDRAHKYSEVDIEICWSF